MKTSFFSYLRPFLRYTKLIILSFVFHASTIALIVWCSLNKLDESSISAGRNGNGMSMNVIMLNMEEMSPTVGGKESAETNLENGMASTATVPQRAGTSLSKPMQQTPLVKLPATVKQRLPDPAAKKTVQRVHKPSRRKDSQSSQQTNRQSSAGKTASTLTQPSSSPDTIGNSNSGNALQGAGTTSSKNIKALNRRVNYPPRARMLGVEGRVRLMFDITASGTVTNIRTLTENPTGVFTTAVYKDMVRWRYQTQQAMSDQVISIVFTLDGGIKLEN